MDDFYILQRMHTKTRNNLEQVVTTYSELELPGTSWNHLERAEPSETRWNHLERDEPSNKLTQKQEIYSTKLYLQYHYPTEYNISNSFYRKEHHVRWNETTWNKMEPVTRLHTKKTLIGQHCVHNIISLQNIINTYSHKDLHLRCRQSVLDSALLCMGSII